MIPDDCLNRTQITKLLENQLEIGKLITQSEEEYNERVSAVKTKLWHVRYRCYPA
jgi:hypothetical protein